jgi:hypothetical protein
MRRTPLTPRGTCLAVLCHVALMVVSVDAYSAETLKTTTGRHFTNVRILQVDPNGVMIRHRDGIAKVLFEDLSKSDRQKYRYNEEKAKAFVESRRQTVVVPVAGAESEGAGAATNVNLNLRINVASASRPTWVWTIPYPYYRYPKSRAIWSNDFRPVVYRPYYPYNTYAYLHRQGLIRHRYAVGCGNPGLVQAGYIGGYVGCNPFWGGMSIREQLLAFHEPFLARWNRGMGGYW